MNNILFVERALDPTFGGVERVTYTLSEAFKKVGYQCYFFYCYKDSNLIEGESKLRLNEQDGIDDIYQQFSLFITAKQINIIICQNVYAAKFLKVYEKVKENFNVKFISCLHGNPDIWVNKNKWGCTTTKIYVKELIRSVNHLIHNPYKERFERMYQVSDTFVLLSESFIPVFKKLHKTNDDEGKLVAISNPCTFNTSVENTDGKENIVLVVSRMAEQQKRISNVLKIWKDINNDSNWKLVLVGDGPDMNLYKSIEKKIGLSNVEFVGHSNQVEQYYKKSKIFLMTSIWEGLPMTILEAQHYGCVPVAFDTYAAVRDAITDNKNGFVVEKHNIRAFRNKVECLMQDEVLLKKMSLNAIKTSSDQFNVHKIIQRWMNLIN